MQGIYSYIPEKASLYGIQCRSCSVFTIRATCNAVLPVKYVLHFHVSTLAVCVQRSVWLVFCSSVMSCFPGMLFWYCLSGCEMVPFAPLMTGITFASHSTCAEFLLWGLYILKSQLLSWSYFCLQELGRLLTYYYYYYVSCMWERRGAYRVLVGKPEGKEPLGRPRRRWDNNIKMDLEEV